MIGAWLTLGLLVVVLYIAIADRPTSWRTYKRFGWHRTNQWRVGNLDNGWSIDWWVFQCEWTPETYVTARIGVFGLVLDVGWYWAD